MSLHLLSCYLKTPCSNCIDNHIRLESMLFHFSKNGTLIFLCSEFIKFCFKKLLILLHVPKYYVSIHVKQTYIASVEAQIVRETPLH